jgi:V8-like Glu-specific endopeptidase
MFIKSHKSKLLLRSFALVTILVSLLGAWNISTAGAQSGTTDEDSTSVQSPILEPVTDPQKLLLPNIASVNDVTGLSADTRVRITPTTSVPWQHIARILFYYPNGSWKICSGFFIGPYTVATAGHCVHDMARVTPGGVNGWATSAKVYPGYDAGVEPFGEGDALQLYSTQAWIERQDPLYDYGAVYLSSPLGNTVGWFDYAYFSDTYLTSYFTSGLADIAGYPLDKDALCLDSGSNPVHAGCLWDDNGTASITSTVLNYSISTDADIPGTPVTNAGQDGSPIWINDSGNLYAIGLNLFNAGDTLCSAGKNCGLRITSSVAANFLTWSNKMPLTDPMGAGVYDDTSASWLYTSTWTSYSGSGPYLNTLHYTSTSGAAATFMFNGVQFIFTYTTYSNRCSFEIWLDGSLLTTIDSYSASITWQRTYASPVFANGVHTVMFKNIGPSGITDVDAIQVIAPIGAGMYDDTYMSWVYAGTGTWATYSGSGPYLSTIHYSNSVGATASVTFHGTQFILSYTAYSNRGQFEVWVDGVLITTINAYSTSLAWQRTYTSPSFATGVHTLMIKNVDPAGAIIDIDAIQIIAPVDVGIYDDSSASWIYGAGTWVTYSSAGPYGGAFHYTDAIGATASFAFNGIRFFLVYTGNTNRGSFEVWVDGVFVETLNEYNSGGLAWQRKYASPTYTFGVHTVVFKNVGPAGTYVDIDAIQILATPDLLAPDVVGSLAATSGTANGSIDLSWVSPFQDTGVSTSGPVLTYQIRYSQSNIVSESDWSAATPVVTGIPAPVAPGSLQTMTIGGMIPGLVYYVAVRGQDTGHNLGPIVAVAVTPRSPTPASAGIYDDNNASWVYTGSWMIYSSSGPYLSTLHFTGNSGASASFVFNGSQFILTYTANTNRCSFNVRVDGALVTTVNAYNATLAWQRTYTSPVFSSGVHTVSFENAGPSGITDIDVIQIITPMGAGIYDDANTAWSYTGTWTTYSGSGPYINTLHYTGTVGSAASFMFKGTQFALNYTANSNRGPFEVWVDGAQVTTINAYSATLTWQRTYTSPVYSYSVHTVVLKNAGPSGITDVDAIQIVAPVSVGTYDDTYSAWTYGGGTWSTYSGTGPYSGTLHYSSSIGATASFVFSGTQFILTYTANSSRGSFEVWVDGVLETTINANNASLIWQKTYTSLVYAQGTHTVIFKNVGPAGSITDIDAIQIFASMSAGLYDDADVSWAYGSGWSGFTGTGPYLGTLHYTNIIGAAATFRFTGTQFVLVYTAYANRGSFEVWVDGVYAATVNAYSSSASWQRTYTSPLYSAGDHTVMFKNIGPAGAYSDVDAIRILP